MGGVTKYRLLHVVVTTLILAAFDAGGQTIPKYRLTDLGVLPGACVQESEAFDINNQGQAVGWSNFSGCVRRAFRWSDVNRAIDADPGMINLGVLPSAPGGNSEAYGINEAGQIVGRSHFDIAAGAGVNKLRAFLWLPQPACNLPAGIMNNLGILGSTSGNESHAYGINDGVPFKVVGYSVTDLLCTPTAIASHAFRWSCDTQTMIDIGSSLGDDQSTAFALNSSGPTSVGLSSFCGDTGMDQCGQPGHKAGEPTTWINTLAGAMPQPAAFQDFNGSGEDINDAGNAAGWGVDVQTECRDRALFWPSPLAVACNLHIIDIPLTTPDPTPSGTDATRALGLNQRDAAADAVEVVGTNTTIDRALLWQGTTISSSCATATAVWEVLDLNQTFDLDRCGWDRLIQAREINDYDWVVGFGDRSGGLARAFLLVPLGPCPADICGAQTDEPDGVVGINDLLCLLMSWGLCPVSEICWADFTGPIGLADCEVGINELLELLQVWGPCAEPGSESVPQTVQECLQRYNDPDEQAACICIVEPCTNGCPPERCP